MTITVIDNFLEKQYFSNLEETILGETFSWYFDTVENDMNKFEDKQIYNSQLTHMFFFQYEMYISNHINLVRPLFQFLDAKAIIQIKANMTHKTGTPVFHNCQENYPFDYKTAILCINTNDGKVKFENEYVECIKNRIIIFDSYEKYCTTTSTDTNRRVMLTTHYL